MKKISSLALALILTACGGNPAQEVEQLIEEGRLDEALRLAQNELDDNPNNNLLRAMAARLLTENCVRTDCTSTNPSQLTVIAERLNGVPLQIAREEQPTYNVYDEILTQTQKMLAQEEGVEDYLTFVSQALPESAPEQRFLASLNQRVIKLLEEGDSAAAKALMSEIMAVIEGDDGQSASPEQDYIMALLDGEMTDALRESYSQQLQNNQQIRQDFARIAPLLVTENYRHKITEGRDKTSFIEDLKNPITTLGLSGIRLDDIRSTYAQRLETLSTNTAFTEQLASLIEAPASVISAQKYAESMLLKVGLILEPESARRWRAFFTQALNNTELGSDMSYLYDNIDLPAMPANVIMENNREIVERAEQALASQENVVPILREVIYRADAQQVAFAEQSQDILRQAMDVALENNNVEQLRAYAEYDPELATRQSERILDIFRKQIAENWRQNDFEPIKGWANFLSDVIDLPYSLDVQLVDLLTEYLDSPDIKRAISSNDPRDMLKTIEEAAYDLGPKMNYVRDHFSDRGDIVQAKLKTLALEADGTYGTANTLLRLRKYFTMDDWLEEFTNALKIALNADKQTPALEMSKIGQQLADMWQPGINYNFVINNVFERTNKLEELRTVWQGASDKFKNTVDKLRPQLASLMRAIDAYEAGDMASAAESFKVVTDQSYLSAAQKYLDDFSDMISPYIGVYVATDVSQDMRLGMFTVERGDELLTAKVTFINAVGMISEQEEFTVDKGNVYTLSYNADFMPKSNTLSISREALAQETDISLERMIGSLDGIRFTDEGDVEITMAGEPHVLEKVRSGSAVLPLPQGKYGITEQMSAHDENADHVLPIGSILEFTTEAIASSRTVPAEDGTAKQITAHNLTGTVLHPSQRGAIPIEGYFNPRTGIVSINFSYPINNGRTILDADLRCQVLGANILCAGQNRHWSRQRFTHIVEGKKVVGRNAPTDQ